MHEEREPPNNFVSKPPKTAIVLRWKGQNKRESCLIVRLPLQAYSLSYFAHFYGLRSFGHQPMI